MGGPQNTVNCGSFVRLSSVAALLAAGAGPLLSHGEERNAVRQHHGQGPLAGLKGSALCCRPLDKFHVRVISSHAFLCFRMAAEHLKCMQAKEDSKSNVWQEGQMEKQRWEESEKSREEARSSEKRKCERVEKS